MRRWATCAWFAAAGAFWALRGPAPAEAGPPPVFQLHDLEVRGKETATGRIFTRRVRLGIPRGWTGEKEHQGRALRLFGPEGEGRILVAIAFNPRELSTFLTELKTAHPSAAPSPPQPMDLPGIRTDLGERATRFVVTGREVGELVMIEKRGLIVLIATVVAPDAWEPLKPLLAKAYTTVDVR